MTRLKPNSSGNADEPIVKRESRLLKHLKSEGQLRANADLQDLLQWAYERGISDRIVLRRLGKDIRNGTFDVRQKASQNSVPGDNKPCAPHTRVSSKHRKIKVSRPASINQERIACDAKRTRWKEVNTARAEFEMLPSELAALTHLQVTGELPPDADLMDLLEWCRKSEVSHDQLREAGDKIRLSDSASQRAYQERLDRLTREWEEPSNVQREISPSEAIASTTHNTSHRRGSVGAVDDGDDFDVPHRPRPFRPRKCKRDLADFRYPSVFTRSRLNDPPGKQLRYSDVCMMPTGLQGKGEISSDAQLPKLSERGYANKLCHCVDLREVGNRIVRGKPMWREASNGAHREHLDLHARQEIESLQDLQAEKEDDSDAVPVEDADDLDAAQMPRLEALPEAEMNQLQVQKIDQPAHSARDAYLAEDNCPGISAPPAERSGYSRRVAAGNMDSFEHDLAPEPQDLEGDIVFVQYEGELDLPARQHITNGKLLDDMDIDGV